ncbi:MAG: hypothetical protein IPO41_12315 [Acidobacteria bacterium]|nr:hypothetical protein [Acidobacteriota bacterium]MBP7474685.1 hypothetical protein [Pyrinomonadaceae bacterium]
MSGKRTFWSFSEPFCTNSEPHFRPFFSKPPKSPKTASGPRERQKRLRLCRLAWRRWLSLADHRILRDLFSHASAAPGGGGVRKQ